MNLNLTILYKDETELMPSFLWNFREFVIYTLDNCELINPLRDVALIRARSAPLLGATVGVL